MRPRLLFTVDVEEDMPGWKIAETTTVSNARALPDLAERCARLGVRPTWLCSYPMASEPESAAILRGLAARGDCELGTHLHPWNTPPFEGVPGRSGDERRQTYYMYELGPERFARKLARLHAAVGALSGREPRSFRAGRFGLDAPTLRELVRLDYEVDTSVTPLAEHTADGGPDFRRAPQHPYRPAHDDVQSHGDLPIVEIPVSIGLTRRLPRSLQRAYVHLPRATRLRGLLSRDGLGLLDYAWLYPVRFELELMTRAADVLVAGGAPTLNVFLHSSELVPGMSGRMQTPADVASMLARLEGLFRHCLEALGAEPCTLAEAGRALRPALGLA